RLQLPGKPESVTAWSPAAIPVAVTLSLAPMVPDCPVSRVSVYPAGRFDPVVVVLTVRLPVAGGGAAQLIAKLACAVSPPDTLTVSGFAPPMVQLGVTPASVTTWLPAARPTNVTTALIAIGCEMLSSTVTV